MAAKFDYKLTAILVVVAAGWIYHLMAKNPKRTYQVNENPLVDDNYYAYDHLAPVDMLSYKQHKYTQTLDDWWCSQAQNFDIGKSQFGGGRY